MLYGEKNKQRLHKARGLVIGIGQKKHELEIPKYKLNKLSMPSEAAKSLIESLLLDEGNSRMNMATFCQTYMEKAATELMAETLDKNAIDKSEYPQTAELENRCVNILADLWHAPKNGEYLGTSTVGSSEACMLAGMAMKFRWRHQAEKLGIDVDTMKPRPNLVISSAYQVCWEKFCVYWDVEMRTVPVNKDDLTLDLDHVLDHVDDHTIGIVGIQGTTYSGDYDNIKGLNALVEQYNKEHTDRPELVIHIDGACGGMLTPFTEPELQWDFRLPNVVSISTSGHKYGLTYPGVGWIIWRDRKYLPEELIFEVSYLGGDIADSGLFDMYNQGHRTPIVCYTLKKDAKYSDGTPVVWNLYDLADRLQMHGWQVPAYPLPKGAEDVTVQRIVCRADLTFTLTEAFVNDFNKCLEDLKEAHVLCNEKKSGRYGFTY